MYTYKWLIGAYRTLYNSNFDWSDGAASAEPLPFEVAEILWDDIKSPSIMIGDAETGFWIRYSLDEIVIVVPSIKMALRYKFEEDTVYWVNIEQDQNHGWWYIPADSELLFSCGINEEIEEDLCVAVMSPWKTWRYRE